ncbi:MAG: VapE domain-containing protein [Breznakia sp.]
MYIAIGKSRKDKKWKNTEMSWSQFLDRVNETHRTIETQAEYNKMSKIKQGDIKDIGGFVAGKLIDGRRLDANVVSRSMLTLDLDFAPLDFWETYSMLFGYTSCIYSTHKHSDRTPRYRLVVPLSRDVTPEEYEAIARMLTKEIDIDYFDDTTYQPSRLMYWPSTSKDGVYVFEHQEGMILNADEYLSKYDDWKDVSFWPMSSRIDELKKKGADKQGDPLSKDGLIGSFCRTYTIVEAIDKFLSDVYESCDIPNRYTYLNGSTSAGVVIYEDKFAYSNHSTDPASMMLCNAFDLVRIHKFGDLDIDAKESTPINKKPSWVKMMDLIRNDEEAKKTIAVEHINTAQDDFEDLIDINKDEEWIKELTLENNGEFEATISNFVIIMRNDPNLKDSIGGVDEFAQKVVKRGKLPWWDYDPYKPGWTDDDDAGMRLYLESTYGLYGRNNIYDAQRIVHRQNAWHPLRDYLDSLEWDGIERLDTTFIDYLGVEDNEYSRMATRKSLTAAVKRVYEPGCKFDYMVVLYGPQGVGKSYIIYRLSKMQTWFTDNVKTFKGKEAHEAIQGKWLCELGELSALKRSDIEISKQFISMQSDTYRKAYDRNPTDNPRTCIFFGTTNKQEFLKDNTGNRRYWPLDVNILLASKDLFKDLTDYEIDQIWAEAKYRYEQKESMWLGKELEKVAMGHQEAHREEDYRKELIIEYLDKELPKDWYEFETYKKQEFLEGNLADDYKGTMLRERVCAREIIDELLYKDVRRIDNFVVKDINDILRELPDWEYKKSVKFPNEKNPKKGFIRR